SKRWSIGRNTTSRVAPFLPPRDLAQWSVVAQDIHQVAKPRLAWLQKIQQNADPEWT
ncbi:unnamed protein product, partial [Amoebophrya sp. A120]